MGAGPVDEIDGEGSWLATVAWLTDHEHPYEFVAGYIAERDENIATPDVFWISASKRFHLEALVRAGRYRLRRRRQRSALAPFPVPDRHRLRLRRVSISLRHLSNANTGGRNRGETFLLVDYGF